MSILLPRDQSSGRHLVPAPGRTPEPTGEQSPSDRSVSESIESSSGPRTPSGILSRAPREDETERGNPSGGPTGEAFEASETPSGRHRSPGPSPDETHPDHPLETAVEDFAIEVVVDDRDATAAEVASAERYLVQQVLTMLGVEGAVSETAVEAVAETGMVLITIEDGEPNAAETLNLMLESDDAFRSGTLERGLRELLNGRISTWQLHRWVEERFFEVHSSDWDGNPPVWHLSTSSGAFQVLIRADRLGFGHLHDLLHRILKTIDRLTTALEAAGGADDWAQVEAIEARFAEVRSFSDLILDMIQRHWQVGGELDRAAKLAVMVDLGFVPTTVATAQKDREVDTITPAASLGGDQRPMREMSDSV